MVVIAISLKVYGSRPKLLSITIKFDKEICGCRCPNVIAGEPLVLLMQPTVVRQASGRFKLVWTKHQLESILAT
jgi:hypothetical protein